MDKGAFIRNGYTVEPGDGGSFVVTEGGHRFGNAEEGKWRIRSWRGFTSYRDLLAWLGEEHESNSGGPTDKTQANTDAYAGN